MTLSFDCLDFKLYWCFIYFYILKYSVCFVLIVVGGFFCKCWAGLLPAALGPKVLSGSGS